MQDNIVFFNKENEYYKSIVKTKQDALKTRETTQKYVDESRKALEASQKATENEYIQIHDSLLICSSNVLKIVLLITNEIDTILLIIKNLEFYLSAALLMYIDSELHNKIGDILFDLIRSYNTLSDLTQKAIYTIISISCVTKIYIDTTSKISLLITNGASPDLITECQTATLNAENVNIHVKSTTQYANRIKLVVETIHIVITNLLNDIKDKIPNAPKEEAHINSTQFENTFRGINNLLEIRDLCEIVANDCSIEILELIKSIKLSLSTSILHYNKK